MNDLRMIELQLIWAVTHGRLVKATVVGMHLLLVFDVGALWVVVDVPLKVIVPAIVHSMLRRPRLDLGPGA